MCNKLIRNQTLSTQSLLICPIDCLLVSVRVVCIILKHILVTDINNIDWVVVKIEFGVSSASTWLYYSLSYAEFWPWPCVYVRTDLYHRAQPNRSRTEPPVPHHAKFISSAPPLYEHSLYFALTSWQILIAPLHPRRTRPITPQSMKPELVWASSIQQVSTFRMKIKPNGPMSFWVAPFCYLGTVIHLYALLILSVLMSTQFSRMRYHFTCLDWLVLRSTRLSPRTGLVSTHWPN